MARRSRRGDPLFGEWARRAGRHVRSNGAALAVIARRSRPEPPVPDLFCMALLARFEGYFPGYSRMIADAHDYLTWVVLKAHTNNRAGTVTLRSADPRDPPRSTSTTSTKAATPAAATCRRSSTASASCALTAALMQRGLIAEEELPGAAVADRRGARRLRARQRLGPSRLVLLPDRRARARRRARRDFARARHARLRVVDASVFPRIPGFFIASAIYMIAEKAADVILHDARAGTKLRRRDCIRTWSEKSINRALSQ